MRKLQKGNKIVARLRKEPEEFTVLEFGCYYQMQDKDGNVLQIKIQNLKRIGFKEI